jgi:HK97 family phage portal protein
MGALDRIRDTWRRWNRPRQRAWPVGPGVVEPYATVHGHDDDQYSPESYGDYLVTSAEIFAAASLRARLSSTVPLRVYRGHGADKRELPNSPAAKLLAQVNPFWSWERLARMDELSMCLWGESYWAIERGPDGQPKEIWWLKPSRVKPVPHESGYLKGFLYESSVNGIELRFAPEEIVWFRYPNPLDEFSALSPVAAARLAADTSSAMMKANRNLHKQGLQIAGVVTPPEGTTFAPDQATQLADDLEHRFSGADRAHRWAVLRFQAKFQPVTIAPKDAEFLGGLGLTLRQVANAYGIPAPLLNDMEHATLANVRDFQTGLWEHALVPDLTLRAGDIREQFLPMFTGRGAADHCEFDFSGVPALQKARSEAWDRERQAIEVGAMTINEWRAKNGLPSVPWGDVWWAPVNKSSVDSAESHPEGDTTPTGEQDAEPPAPAVVNGGGRVLLDALDIPVRSLS